MGVTEGAWRIKAILFIVIMMTALYGSQALFLDVDISVGGAGSVENYNITNQNLSDAEALQTDASGDILSTIGFVIEFATFQAPDGMPVWASWTLSLFALCLVITLAYIIYTFVYEIIKGLPFT